MSAFEQHDLKKEVEELRQLNIDLTRSLLNVAREKIYVRVGFDDARLDDSQYSHYLLRDLDERSERVLTEAMHERRKLYRELAIFKGAALRHLPTAEGYALMNELDELDRT